MTEPLSPSESDRKHLTTIPEGPIHRTLTGFAYRAPGDDFRRSNEMIDAGLDLNQPPVTHYLEESSHVGEGLSESNPRVRIKGC